MCPHVSLSVSMYVSACVCVHGCDSMCVCMYFCVCASVRVRVKRVVDDAGAQMGLCCTGRLWAPGSRAAGRPEL